MLSPNLGRLPQRRPELPADPDAPLSAGTAEAFAAALRPRAVPKGAYFSLAGAAADELALVERGVLRLVFVDEDGRELTKHFFAEGAWLASNLERGRPPLASVQALADSRLWVVPLAEAEALMRGRPDLLWWFNRRLVSYLETKQRREAAIVNRRGLARYAAFRAAYPDLEARVPLRHVASHLGMTPTQLSRVRRKMAR